MLPEDLDQLLGDDPLLAQILNGSVTMRRSLITALTRTTLVNE